MPSKPESSKVGLSARDIKSNAPTSTFTYESSKLSVEVVMALTMKSLRILFALSFVLLCSAIVEAQSDTNQQAYDEALPQFARLLGSEDEAKEYSRL
jgi:uncharacterized membrane protein YadS